MKILNLLKGLFSSGRNVWYHMNKVNYDYMEKWNINDNHKLTTLKNDMSNITGYVYCNRGTIGYHENGKKHGTHKNWNYSKVTHPLVYKGSWEMGKREGTHKWYDTKYDGNRGWRRFLCVEANYKNDILNGSHKEWHENGQLLINIEWHNGVILTNNKWNLHGERI